MFQNIFIDLFQVCVLSSRKFHLFPILVDGFFFLFQSVELFSYIGGYMGMWLGISLVSLFDFVEMIFDVLAYPAIKWKKKRKKSKQIGHFQRGTMYNMYDI